VRGGLKWLVVLCTVNSYDNFFVGVFPQAFLSPPFLRGELTPKKNAQSFVSKDLLIMEHATRAPLLRIIFPCRL